MRRPPVRLPPSSFCLPVLALLALASCVTSYHPEGALGDGFSERKVAPDRWIVRFAAGTFTPRERIEKYVLYRCAEIAQENGSRYFVVFRPLRTPVAAAATTPTLIDAPVWADIPASRRREPGREETVLLQLFGARKPLGYQTAYETRDVLRDLASRVREQ
jgi:hypothetical protein